MIRYSSKLKAQSLKLKQNTGNNVSLFFSFNFYLLAFSLFFLAFSIQLSTQPVSAATVGPVDGAQVTVSAVVGEITPIPPPPGEEKRFAIFGHTSPHAVVKIQSPIYGETQADATGAYEFKYLFLTLFREDLCIVAYDTEGRSTPPLCIPPPTTQTDKRVGPVVLPPSTSISAGNAYIGDTVTLTGQTIPNADVKLALFTDDKAKNKKLSLIPEANAYTIPQVSLSSNKKGEYSVVLPTTSSQFLRMFSRAIFNDTSTPKGNTLVLDIFPMWMIIFKFFANLLSILKNHLVEFIIIDQLYFLLLYVVKRFSTPHIISRHRQNELAVIHGTLMVVPHDLAVQSTALARREVALLVK